MTTPRTIAVAALVAAAVSANGAAPAGAAARADVCVARAAVYDSPGGMVVGVLARGTRVSVLRRDARRRWARVRSPQEITGWTRSAHLC